MKHFTQKQKAIDHAMWLNFENPNPKNPHGIIPYEHRDFLVCDLEFSQRMKVPFMDILPDNYSLMEYADIRTLRTDIEPLNHWELLYGSLSTVPNNVLRFVLHYKIPIEKFIRYELSISGFDATGKWIGFDDSDKIWLK